MQTSASQPDRLHWPSLLQLGFSVLAALACLGIAFMLALGGIVNIVSSGPVTETNVSYLLLAAGVGISGLLLIPSAVYALFGLQNRSSPFMERLEVFSRRVLRPVWLVLLFPVVLLGGHLVSRSAQLAWFTLPLLHVLAVGLPILWLVLVGLRGLPLGSNQRAWGIFGFGLIAGPSLIMVFEIIALGVIFLLGMVYVAINPELARDVQTLAFRLQYAARSPDDIVKLLSPYLVQPLVLYTIFAFTTGIVPLIEEIFKPLGVWLLVVREITPAEGFAAGLLSGAGYALFENLALSTSAGGEWTAVVVARVGTGLLHIVTAGLTGWALAGAWKEGRYLRLGLTYLGVVLLHGIWNSMALLSTAQNFSPAGSFQFDPRLVSSAATIILAALALVMFILLLVVNSALRRSYKRAPDASGELGVVFGDPGLSNPPDNRDVKETS